MDVPQNYRPNTIRGIIISLMNEFRGIKVENFDNATGSIVKTIDVPLQFGHDEKYYQAKKRNEETTNNDYYMKVPKVSLSWDSVVFNGNRAKGNYAIRKFYDEDNEVIDDIDSFITNVSPIAYDFGFSLEIRTEKLNHFTQIMENILPYFKPARTIRVKEFSFLNIERDLNVRLDGISQDFLNEQTEDSKRYCNGVLNLTVEGFLYKPFETSKIIKTINTRYFTNYNIDLDDIVEGYSTSGYSDEPYPTSGFSISGTEDNFNWYKDKI